jgi:hypothetical protein
MIERQDCEVVKRFVPAEEISARVKFVRHDPDSAL